MGLQFLPMDDNATSHRIVAVADLLARKVPGRKYNHKDAETFRRRLAARHQIPATFSEL